VLGWKRMNRNGNQKRKSKPVTENKEIPYIMIKVFILQEAFTILSLYTLNLRSPKYMTKLKEEREQHNSR
jgi:hypothetical protein